MKKFLLILAFLFIGSLSIKADFHHQWDISVGVQPVGIKVDEVNHKINVFCAGYDANFNGVKDSGDVNPSWWSFPELPILTINGLLGTAADKVRDFEFGAWDFFAPFNPGYDISAEKGKSVVYISQFGRIRAYDMLDGSIVKDTVANYYSTATFVKGDTLFLSVRNGSDKGNVILINKNTGTILDTIPAEVNVQKVMVAGSKVVILNEGTYGKGDSKLIIAEKKNNVWQTKSLLLGDGANDFAIDDLKRFVAITMNGSHEVKVVALAIDSVITSFSTGTTGYDGPRSIKFNQEYNQPLALSVTSYSGDIMIFSLNGMKLQTISAEGKTEGIDFQLQTWMIVANQFFKNTYDPDTLVSLYSTPMEVSEPVNPAAFKLYPNPCTDGLKFSFPENFGRIEQLMIINELGQVIYSGNTQNIDSQAEQFLNVSALQNGSYFLRIKSSGKRTAIPFNVIR